MGNLAGSFRARKFDLVHTRSGREFGSFPVQFSGDGGEAGACVEDTVPCLDTIWNLALSLFGREDRAAVCLCTGAPLSGKAASSRRRAGRFGPSMWSRRVESVSPGNSQFWQSRLLPVLVQSWCGPRAASYGGRVDDLQPASSGLYPSPRWRLGSFVIAPTACTSYPP